MKRTKTGTEITRRARKLAQDQVREYIRIVGVRTDPDN
jgi:hypothetical protein